MYKIFEVYNRPSEMETQINQFERDGYRLQSLTTAVADGQIGTDTMRRRRTVNIIYTAVMHKSETPDQDRRDYFDALVRNGWVPPPVGDQFNLNANRKI